MITVKPDKKLNDAVHHEQMQLIQSESTTVFLGAVTSACFFSYVLFNETNNNALIAWLVSIVTVYLFRHLMAKKPIDKNHGSHRWEYMYVAGTFVTALIWGIGSYYLVPVDNHILLAIVILTIGGISATAAITYAASRMIAVAFIGPVILILSALLFQQHTNVHFTMGILTLIYGVAMVSSNRHMHNEIKKNFELVKDNRDLVNDLLKVNKQAGELNEQLEEKIDQINNLANKMSYEASHDMLTGLVNRREFEARLINKIDAARDENITHCMCYIDLDEFKVINDTCGHVAGDELLQQLSLHLMSKTRSSDTLARLGGDEFGLLLNSCDVEHAVQVAENVLTEISEFKFYWGEKAFSIGASIGVVEINPGSGSITEVLKSADSACYVAKDSGKNRVHVFLEDDDALSSRMEHMQCMHTIQSALKSNRFELYFQSIQPASGDIDDLLHGEILLRMLDDEGNLVSPNRFIPSAERYRLMKDIDQWVIRSALQLIRQLEIKHRGKVNCSINLSGQSICESDFLGKIISEINSSRVSPESLCFEITETSAISNFFHAERLLNTLKGMGCRFALDDFGSGLSSFGYLKKLDVDYLKIDGSFVRNMLNDDKDFAMVKSINQVGKAMGMKTIAEFVETDALREKLCHIGVDYVQGYGIGRAVPISEIIE